MVRTENPEKGKYWGCLMSDATTLHVHASTAGWKVPLAPAGHHTEEILCNLRDASRTTNLLRVYFDEKQL